MKLKFICANHGRWLETRPQEALNCWASSMETGLYYQDQAMWHASIAPLGCAYEIACILLQESELIDSDQLLRFSDSAKRLTYSMMRANEHGLAAENVQGVQSFFTGISKRYFDRLQVLTLIRELRAILLTETCPVDLKPVDLRLSEKRHELPTLH